MDDLTSKIRAVRFTPVRLTDGYDQGEVDQFLDTLITAVAAGQDLGPMIVAARFTTTRVREGYRMAEVDQFLDTLTTTPGAPAGGTEPPAYAAPPAPTPVVEPEPRPADDRVVQEVPGLFSRLFKRR